MATKKMTRAERAEAEREARRVIAGMPETKALFERAHREPHVKGLEVTAYGLRVEFQALGVDHVNELLDAIARIRRKQARAKKRSAA